MAPKSSPRKPDGVLDHNGRLLVDTLACLVPICLARLRAQGGPTADDWDRAGRLAVCLAARGDVLPDGGKPGQAADLVTRLGHAVAVMAYVPGGITLFGQHYEATAPPGAGEGS